MSGRSESAAQFAWDSNLMQFNTTLLIFVFVRRQSFKLKDAEIWGFQLEGENLATARRALRAF